MNLCRPSKVEMCLYCDNYSDTLTHLKELESADSRTYLIASKNLICPSNEMRHLPSGRVLFVSLPLTSYIH